MCGDSAVVVGAVVVFVKVPVVDQSLVVSTGAAVRERLENFDVAKELRRRYRGQGQVREQ